MLMATHILLLFLENWLLALAMTWKPLVLLTSDSLLGDLGNVLGVTLDT